MLFQGNNPIRKDLALRADNLELAIDMGWFWFISQPMVWILDKINSFIGNWGLSIVLFTILLKILLWPVTAKGFKSMAGMRKVAGPMKEIQERYDKLPTVQLDLNLALQEIQ